MNKQGLRTSFYVIKPPSNKAVKDSPPTPPPNPARIFGSFHHDVTFTLARGSRVYVDPWGTIGVPMDGDRVALTEGVRCSRFTGCCGGGCVPILGACMDSVIRTRQYPDTDVIAT